jgi:hypothetical protein
MEYILSLLIDGAMIVIPLIWIYGLYKIYNDASMFWGLLGLLLILLIYRMYSNHSVGGMLIPLNGKEFKEWIFNDVGPIEALIWIGLIVTPLFHAFAETCPECGSSEVKEISKELVSKDLNSRMVDVLVGRDEDNKSIYIKEKEYYNILTFDITMQCKECNHIWVKQKTEQEKI